MRILILGCGWVGEELAIHLLRMNFEVFATCTSVEKKAYLNALNVHTVIMNFDDLNVPSSLPRDFDFILTSVPASSKNDVDTVANRFSSIRDFLSNIKYKQHVYLSSTGIYPDVDGHFDESYSQNLIPRLQVAEDYLAELPDTAIFRLGGLFGKQRIFAKYFQDRICNTGDQLANFVHLDDVVQVLIQTIVQRIDNGVYNIVAPEHPTKKEVILASAKKYGFKIPQAFDPKDSFQKIVDGAKIIKKLDYTFKYPSPLDF